MLKRGPFTLIVITVAAWLLCKASIGTALWNIVMYYPLWYQSVFPDVSLYYVGLVILSILSVLIFGICFVTTALILGVVLKDMI